MPKITAIFAILLILLGVIGFAGDSKSDAERIESNADSVTESPATDQAPATTRRSVTALIPAFAGGLLLVMAILSISDRSRMHAMHGAAVIGLLGFLAAAGRGAAGLVKLSSGDDDVNTRSLFFVCVMAILCGTFLFLCVSSFVQARRRRLRDSA